MAAESPLAMNPAFKILLVYFWGWVDAFPDRMLLFRVEAVRRIAGRRCIWFVSVSIIFDMVLLLFSGMKRHINIVE